MEIANKGEEEKKGQGTRDKAQGTRDKGQGTRHKAQGTRHRERSKIQGAKARKEPRLEGTFKPGGLSFLMIIMMALERHYQKVFTCDIT